jgi:hypothetical protein
MDPRIGLWLTCVRCASFMQGELLPKHERHKHESCIALAINSRPVDCRAHAMPGIATTNMDNSKSMTGLAMCETGFRPSREKDLGLPRVRGRSLCESPLGIDRKLLN